MLKLYFRHSNQQLTALASLNDTKTECLPINIRNRIELKTLANNILKYVDDYKYLGSHIINSEKDYQKRNGMGGLQ